jgi:hypothetical protein
LWLAKQFLYTAAEYRFAHAERQFFDPVARRPASTELITDGNGPPTR